MQYAINAHQKCLLLEPLWASPYLVGLVWYALSCFRMCLYQAFFAMRKNSKLKEKTKTRAENSNFWHFFKKKLYSLKTYVVSGLGINITILTHAY